MGTRTVVNFDEQTGITATSDNFMVNPQQEVSVVAKLTDGTPASGARVQFTLDDAGRITDGTATWIDSQLGAHTGSDAEKILRPVTGVRLSAADGTWTFQVRQA